MATTWAPDEALFRLSIANLAATAPVRPVEEKRLIDVMIAGKEASTRLVQNSDLSFEEREILRAKRDEGITSRKTLIQANGRLVISIASKYSGKWD